VPDQRHIETSRYQVKPPSRDPRVAYKQPDDATDPSADRLVDTAAPSPWRLNALGAVLGTALICALLLSVGLFVKLQRVKAELAEAEAAAESAESALARDPDAEGAKGEAGPEKAAAAKAGADAKVLDPRAANGAGKILDPRAANGASKILDPRAANGASKALDPRAANSASKALDPRAANAAGAAEARPAAREGARPGKAPDTVDLTHPEEPRQLVLLLTVGTQHYAEKQLRTLRRRCKAPLHVYQQRRGRCAFSQCWAVAAPAEDGLDLRSCGEVKGQSLRDRKDFVQLP
jgi:hypothetical protein